MRTPVVEPVAGGTRWIGLFGELDVGHKALDGLGKSQLLRLVQVDADHVTVRVQQVGHPTVVVVEIGERRVEVPGRHPAHVQVAQMLVLRLELPAMPIDGHGVAYHAP